MDPSKFDAGFIVITVPFAPPPIGINPFPVTLLLVTPIVSTVLLSEAFLIVMLPLSVSTVSLKVRTMFASTATLVALSAGVDELRVGAVVSTVVKLNAVVLEIPA